MLSRLLVYFLLYLLLSSDICVAFEKLTFDIDKVVTNSWQIKEAKLSLFDLYSKKPQLNLSIKQIALPEPFDNLRFIDISCQTFTWQDNKIVCQKGMAKLKSTFVNLSPFKFSFSISEKISRFSIQNLSIAKGTLSLSAKEERGHWIVSIKSQKIQLKSFAELIQKQLPMIDEISNGSFDVNAKLTGANKELNNLLVHSVFNTISLQAEQGNIATESLDFKIDLFATKKQGIWSWEHSNRIIQGEIYKSPVYIQVKEDQGIQIKTKGAWHRKGDIGIQQANFTQPGVAEISIEGGLIKQQPAFAMESGKIQANIKDLDYFYAHYISPFTAQEGIQLKGQLVSNITLSESTIKQVTAQFTNFMVNDQKNRIEVVNGAGEFNWSVIPDSIVPSNIRWDRFKIRAIPFEAGHVNLLVSDKTIKLLNTSSIPFLNGVFTIDQFDWQHNTDNEPTVYFQGGIKNVSLEQLSQALNWTPLAGNISGQIPGVEYKNKILKVNGELKVEVFGGTVAIDKLASSGLFTDFPKLYMDMEINNLDLYTLTQKFEMGEIEGRVSGFINNLYLENWEPVTFYAWLGTPENDESKHRISQKAVENIASIGGGGAADVISKGFLSLFDTFGYERLGFGCYLHQGVCQLMGVEAAEQGYYIIKGGGLPRIDVIGYNPQVDWKVLMQRLFRISNTEDLVIE